MTFRGGRLRIVYRAIARVVVGLALLLIPSAACLWPHGDVDDTSDAVIVDDDGGENGDVNDVADGVHDDLGGTDASEEDSIFARRPERLIVELEVHRVEAPAGVFGEESPLWKIASQPIASAAVQLRLRSNGFLAAAGRDSDRPDLVAYLESLPKPAIATDRVQPDSSRLVDVEIGR